MTQIEMEPIGIVHSSRSIIQDDHWDREHSHIELDATRFGPEAFAGIELFSHVEVIFFMDRVETAKIETGSRYPRGNTAYPKMGIFAQRAKNRPNRLGATICRVLRLDGRQLHVQGLDAIDGTPVLDVKPWVQEFAPRGPVTQPAWMSELMSDYWGGKA